jgi:N-methylhydantoinase B
MEAAATTRHASRLDPVTFEVLRHSFTALVDEMGVRLERTAFTPVITQALDFSIALLDREGHFVASGRRDMPVHLGTFEFTVAEVRRVFETRGDVHDGDVFLFNDPYSGGTHNQDVRSVRPVFHNGALVAWLLAMCHWPDVGGPVPGSYNPEARDCYAEGLRIPPIKIYERGVRADSIVELVFANIRVPGERTGDLHAMVQALEVGQERLLALIAKYGLDTLELAYRDVWDYAERVLMSQTSTIPDGTYEWTDYIDQDPGDPQRRPVKIHLALHVDQGKLLFDFTDSAPAPIGAVGSPLPTTWSAVLVSTVNMFPGTLLNAGVRRVVDVKTVPGSVIHLLPPKPCCGMACAGYEKVMACAIGAIGLALPGRRTACPYNQQNVTLGGIDPRFGQEYVMYVYTMGGYGASVYGDAGTPSHMDYAPGAKSQPVEISERWYPVIFDAVTIRPDSAGPGFYRGGFGTETRFHMSHGEDHRLTMMGDREKFPAWGVEGGGAGAAQHLVMNPGTDSERDLGMFVAGIPVARNDSFTLTSGGGGGYGDPLAREPTRVLDDVIDEMLTTQGAFDQYGVVIQPVDPEVGLYEIDHDATIVERARRRDLRPAAPEVVAGRGQASARD